MITTTTTVQTTKSSVNTTLNYFDRPVDRDGDHDYYNSDEFDYILLKSTTTTTMITITTTVRTTKAKIS